MGLDMVELILEVEEHFGIELEDEEVAAVESVGDLRDLVWSKLPPSISRDCLTSHVFYRLRSALGSEFGVPRKDVRPASEVDSLVPLSQRRQVWRGLSERLSLDLPELKLAGWLTVSLFAGLILTVLFAIGGANGGLLSETQAWVLGFATIPGVWLAFKVTKPFATHFPRTCRTLGELAKVTLSRNFGRIAEEWQAWNDRELWQAVRSVVAEQAGAKENELTPETRFKQHLGMG